MVANTFQTSTLVAKQMTSFFLQKSPLYNSSNHDYLNEFMQQGYMTGGSINIKIPGYPEAQQGLTVTASAIQDLIVAYPITENDIYSVTRNLNAYETLFKIAGKEGALTKTDKSTLIDNYAYPAYQVLEAKIEQQCAYKLKTTAYITPVDSIDKLTAVNNFNSLSEADQVANDMKLDKMRFMMMNNRDGRLVSNSLQNYFAQNFALPVLKGAFIGNNDKGNLAGFDVYRSTELTKHTAGTLGQSNSTRNLTVVSVAADGTSITFAGALSNTNIQINAGDRISIPSVNLVDNITHTDVQWRLVVTASADARGNGSGQITVLLSYPLLASGEHQTVTALPAGSAAAVVFPDRYLNFGYTKSGLSTVPLKLPMVYGATNSDPKALEFPVHVYIQGAALELQNNFRISTLVAAQAFAPYIVEMPSAV